MPDDTTKLVISLDLILRNLQATLKGLSQVESQLKRVATIKVTTASPAAGFDRAAAAAQKLQNQQDKVIVQTQELANRQERARQTTERLAQSQERLKLSHDKLARATAASGQQQDAHVRVFRANEEAAKKLTKSIQAAGNAFRSIGQGATTLGIALATGLTAPLAALGVSSVQAAVSMDSLKRGLTAIVGSSSEAEKQLKRLTDIAKLPGIGFEEAIQGSIRLQAVGFSAAEAEKSLVQFANAIALTGGGRAELERVTIQLGQLAAKGKVLSQDLRPIIEAAPAVGRALLQAFGTVNADDIQALGLSSKEFLSVLTSQLEKLPRAAAGAKNTFENFRDSVFRASAVIGDALLPALTKLVDVATPIITGLANAFASIPKPIQAIIAVFGGFAAALGPVLFITGQFTTGIGRLIVGISQLNAVGGLGALIKNLRLLAAGSLAAAEAETALAAANTLLIASVAGIGLVLAAVTALYVAYKSGQEDATAATEEQVNASKKVIDAWQEEVKFVTQLKNGVASTAEEQQHLADIYKALGIQAELRIKKAKEETDQNQALREELERLANAEKERLRLAGASIAGKFAQDLQKLIDLDKERLDIEEQLKIVERTDTGLVTDANELVKQHQTLNEKLEKQRETVKSGANALRTYEQVSGESANAAFELSRKLGGLEGVTADVTAGLKEYTTAQKEAATATEALNKIVQQQTLDFSTDFSAIEDALDKVNEKNLDGLIDRIKKTTNSTEEARQALETYLRILPQLRDFVERRRGQKERGTFLEDLLAGKAIKDTGTSLRNAQEQLADAQAKVQERIKEKEIAVERAANDALIRENERRFKLELIGFQEFVNERARLQQVELQGEIDRQQKIADLAAEDAQRARQRAGTTHGAEQTRAQAAEQEALAKQTEAETKILELQSRQKDVQADAANDLIQFTEERLKSFRALSRELDEILGKEKRAGEAAIDERFADQLRELNAEKEKALTEVEQRTARAAFEQQLTDFSAQREALVAELAKLQVVNTPQAAKDRLTIQQSLLDLTKDEIEAAKKLNEVNRADNKETLQAQITNIENKKEQLKSVVALRDAQDKVRDAEEEQANLERDIAFQVEFRGLNEEQAIARRLEGEKKVKAAIEEQQAAIQAVIDKLKAAGLEVPTALLQGVKRFEVAAKGLGELSFTEQFALAEKEFNRIQDELANKIAQVELAVRHRDLAEIQGRILIKKLNGEYVADLERQAEILAAIAAKSGQQGLQKQAADAQQTAREVKAATTEVADFNAALKSVSIDALQQGFEDFFASLTDRTKTAKEKLLDLVNSVAQSIERFIAKRLSEQLIESIFGTPQQQAAGTGGVIAGLRRLFGLGGVGVGSAGGTGGVLAGAAASVGGAGSAAATTALTTAATTAGAALATGGTAASAAMTAGGTALTASIIAAGSAFAAAVAAAGAAFAAAVASAAGAQAFSGLASGAGASLAATGMFPATPGGLVRIVEGGFDEAVLTTDPQHAVRQVSILREFLARTKGLYGRVQGFAEGGMISARDAEMNLLASLSPRASVIPSHAPAPRLAADAVQTNLRILNLIDRGELVSGHLRSATGERDILNIISAHRDEIGRRIGVK